jgi:hypothetical protein
MRGLGIINGEKFLTQLDLVKSHGRMHDEMPAARLDCLDVGEADTDAGDSDGSLHGSIPTLGGTSTAIPVVLPLPLLTFRLPLAELPKLLLVLMLVERVLLNSNSPVISSRLVSRVVPPDYAGTLHCLWDSMCMSSTAPILRRTGFQQPSTCRIQTERIKLRTRAWTSRIPLL